MEDEVICEECGCVMKAWDSESHLLRYNGDYEEPEYVIDYVKYRCPNCGAEKEYDYR